MNIFEIIISPFIFIIKETFLLSYQLTGNYGISIILLSFFISLLLLPIFILIEKAKKKNDSLKLKMKPLIDEIKRCYKGQERFYYLKTLNRQYNYSPFKALIPILSLLLQIPFFIAAYQFLENYEPLAGVSFLFIKNLNAPDALFGAINILPIAMTVVNLLTAYFYTRHGNTSERKQMLVIAGVFLVLLFNLPSGLVLYWAMNNVFSFFRLFITNREVFRKKKAITSEEGRSYIKLKLQIRNIFPTLKKIFIATTIVASLSQLNWSFQNNFDQIILRLFGSVLFGFIITIAFGVFSFTYKKYKPQLQDIKIKPSYFYSLLFFALYFWAAGEFYFLNKNFILLKISLVFLVCFQIIGIVYILRNISTNQNILYQIASFALLFSFICQLFLGYVYISHNEINLTLSNIKMSVTDSSLSELIFCGMLFSFFTIFFYSKEHSIKFSIPDESNWFIYLLSIFYISGLLYFWHPLLIFSSHPQAFDFPAINILQNNLNLFIIFNTIALIFYLLSPLKIKKTILLSILCLVIIVFVNSSIIPLDLGSLQETRFSEHEKLAISPGYFILEAIFILALFYTVLWFLKKKRNVIIKYFLIILNLFLILQSLYSSIQTGNFFNSGKEITNTKSNLIQGEFSFSKNHKNVVFYLADGVQGWFIKQIMEENPDLKETFSGFTWYPNTLSISNFTHSSVPSLMGGFNNSVANMNADTERNIEEKVTDASIKFYNKIKSKGFTFTSTYMHHSKIDKSEFDIYIPGWYSNWERWSHKLNLGPLNEIWYSRLTENAIFYSVPIFLKPKIYNNKEWLQFYKKYFSSIDSLATKQKSPSSFKKYNFIRLLPFISNTKTDKPSFIYIHDQAAHNPWNIVNNKGKMIQNVSPYENNKWIIEQLGKWIEWMKENDVYNNTRIVVVSDHGPSWGQYDGEFDLNSPVNWDKDDPKKISHDRYWRLNALLMEKDYDSQGELIEDWRLMSNADAPALVFDENSPAKNDSTSRVLNTYWTFWKSHIIEQTEMEVFKQFEVKDNVFDLKNWKRIK
ncbi:MAG: membrane protein insertase YidC [Salinivirgaceae bacterium]|nr:membrane protein insertase YidC [Salinivirgaceae bacterium]